MSPDTISKSQVLWLITVGISLLGVQTAKADFVMGRREPVGAPLNSSADDFAMCITTDGLTAYFSSTRPGGYGSDDLWVVTRTAVDQPWGEPVNLGPAVNTTASEGYPSISADGLSLFFSEVFASTTSRPLRPGGTGGHDLWMTTRPTTESDWGIPINLGSSVNTAADERSPCVSADGLSLYFASNRPGGLGTLDLWVSTRTDTASPWTTPVNLGPAINSGDDDADPSLSSDGLTLFFASWGRPEGSGSHDLYAATRGSVTDPWQPAVNLGPGVNSSSADGCPCFWAGGPTLFFISFGSGGFGGADFSQVPITPILDFSGDGRVDGREVRIMAEVWGTEDSLCDISPAPFGDGVIGVADLIAISDFIGKEIDDPTLIAHWKLDETEGTVAQDCQGVADAVLNGNPLWLPEGKIGGALQLNGESDCLFTDFVINPSEGPFSVLMWVLGGAPGQVLLSQTDGANWLKLSEDGTLETALVPNARTVRSPLRSQAVSMGPRWRQVGLVWDGLNRRLYVDEVEVASDNPQGNLASSRGGLNIGCGKDMTPETFFSGLIDDVRIYDRVVKP